MGTSKQVVGLKYTPGNTTAKKFSFKRLFTKNKEVTYDSISDYEVLVSSDNKNGLKFTQENLILQKKTQFTLMKAEMIQINNYGQLMLNMWS